MDDGTAEEEKENTQTTRITVHGDNSKRKANWEKEGNNLKSDSVKGVSKKTSNQSKKSNKQPKKQ
jgi:hypothetical protein